MRIAFIAPFGLQPKGTVSARMMPLAHALARRGHLVRVVIPPWDDPGESHYEHPAHELSISRSGGKITEFVDTVALPLPLRVPHSIGLTAGLVREALKPSPSGFPRYSDQLLPDERELAGFRAEVVHVFKPVGYSGLAGFVLAGMGVSWVLDTDDWEGPGGWADVNPYSPAQKVAVTVQEALLPRLAPVVTAASRTLEARAWDFGLPRGRVFYLPNGVPGRTGAKLKSFHGFVFRERVGMLRANLGLAGRPVLLLYTRFAEFPWQWPLDILQKVVEGRPDAMLLVVGSGFFGEERELAAEADRRGLGGHIVVAGRVPEPDVDDYLSLGDVLLYPMRDTLLNRAKSPVKIVEPMAAGLPVVAHRVGQAAEFVGDTGVLVEPGDLDGMARAALALLGDPERAARLGRLAQMRVTECFNWDVLAATAERAYMKALGRPSGSDL